MSELEDAPTHWIRDLLIGTAVCLAVVQTVRMSGSEAEISKLRQQVTALEHVAVVSKKPALLKLQVLEHVGGELVVHLTPLREANVDLVFTDAAGRELPECSHLHVPLAPELHCNSAAAVSASVTEN